MTNFLQVSIVMAFILSGIKPSFSGEHPDLLKRLHESKLSLVEGMQQVSYDHGPTISAKFEIKNNILKLSIYTVQDGMEVGAEKNPLLELIGDATTPKWFPKRVEFEDKAHIARASVQLTLLQLSKFHFREIIQIVNREIPGMIYSVKPKLINGAAVVEIKVLTGASSSKTVYFDLFTGEI